MVKFLINRPVATFMVTFSVLLLGVFASFQIPISLLPDLNIPEIVVRVSHPSSTARELETNIVRHLRNQLLQVSDLKDIETQTTDGFAILNLSFKYGTNADIAVIEINEKIDASLNYLPKDLERPRVIKASPTDIPLINLTVSLRENYSDERFIELSHFIETVIKKRIEQLPDIALADLNGLVKEEISIAPNRNLIQSLGITNDELITAIKQNNFELGNLSLKSGIYQYDFKFNNPPVNKRDIQDIFLSINNKNFKLGTLADVIVRPEENKGIVYSNGKRSVLISIIKQSDARVYDLKQTLENLIESFNNEYPNIKFTITQDQTKLLKLSIDNLKLSLLIGGLLAIIIVFLFLKDLEASIIIAISIPVSLIVSVFFMYVLDLSINIISLSGLVLGIGMMIDNSIILVDSITQKMESGLSLSNSCIKGTNEIISPLISSVLTTCSVFLPLLFLSGITGELFYDQAISISISLVSSLIVSILLIPVLYKQIKTRKIKDRTLFKRFLIIPDIKNLYGKGYNFFIRNNWIVYSISLASIIAAIILFSTMEYSRLPKFNQDETILDIDWNENINLIENQKRIELVLNSINDIDMRLAQIGEKQFLLEHDFVKSFSESTVYLKVKTFQELSSITKEIEQRFQSFFPTASINFTQPKTVFEYIFGNKKNDVILEVYSTGSFEAPSEEKLPILKKLLEDKATPKVALKRITFIQIIYENLLLYDVDYDDLLNELKTAFNRNFIDNLKTNQRYVPIKLNYNKVSIEKIMSEFFIRNKNRELIPIKNLIKIEDDLKYRAIESNKYGEHLVYNLRPGIKVDSDISEIKERFTNDENFNLRFSGSKFEIKNLGKELLWVIIVAILLLYFIMSAQFESLWQPLIILLEIPIDIGGALLLLWLFGGTINLMAAIGIVVMSGIIINDSILKIHTINLLRRKGYTVNDAIKEGGRLRLKPILMTSLTTILALLPFLFTEGLGAELQKPLALTIIGGMLIGTFISLYFIPLMYYLFSKNIVNAN